MAVYPCIFCGHPYAPGHSCGKEKPVQATKLYDKGLTVDGFIEVCAHRVSWWFRGGQPIGEELRARLEEEAESRAKYGINEGYVSGELCYEDSEHGELTGWWAIEKE